MTYNKLTFSRQGKTSSQCRPVRADVERKSRGKGGKSNVKKVLIVALYRNISRYYRSHLQSLFGESVCFEDYYIENNPEPLDFDGDLIVTSSNILFEHIKRLNRNKIETIVMSRTFTREGFERIKELDDGREMYFVSNFHEIAVECISKLYELGIKDIKLIPYNPLSPYDEEKVNIHSAVIAGETKRIPEFINEVVDIGDRVVDLSTIANIGTILHLPAAELHHILESYRGRLVYTDYGIDSVLSESEDIKRQLKTILHFTNDSIIAADLSGHITEYNESSERSFGLRKSDVLGRKINEVFPELGTDDVLEKGGAVNNEIVTIGHIPYVVNKYGVYNEENELAGVVLFFQKYMEMEKTRNKLRSKMIPKGHEARYTMDSILGKSAVIGELKNIAHKMAESSSTVLITGESGTGKEVFAQAIHNASSRKNMPFIAVNCSALAASLLESELFGYEEGAFTGARKGGKIGLFEMADKGTLFLDEIGEMPFELQAKLLRVLMEREVMRIGGTDLIRVDVRIIAATNKNLLELTREGKFREDLYYRINVLPLPLPPLRERKEDIPMLAQAFLQEFGADKALSGKVLRILRGYDWPGNIRELHNCIEYMYQLSDDTIEAEDIPEHIRFCRCETPRPLYNQLSDRQRQILCAVYDFGLEKRTAGRKSLHLQFAAQGNSVGEQEIRVVLKELEHMGLVEVGKGRRGTTITEWGTTAI